MPGINATYWRRKLSAYLLIGHALRRIALDFGPDHISFPNLCDQPITPSLPNRFLAVLPANMAEHHARGPQFASVTAYARYLANDLRHFLRTYERC
jgi:hypothetical protein